MAVASLTSSVPGVEEWAERNENGVTWVEPGRNADQSPMLERSKLVLCTLWF